MLQKMFPQGGAFTPEIRFKSFSGDWEEKGLEDIVEVCSGRDYKHLSTGNIPVYGTGGYMLSVNEALSYDEDAIGIGRKGTIDKPYLLRCPFWTVDTLFYALAREGYNLDFIYTIFQNIDWKKKDESTGVPSLSKVAINGIQALVPLLLKEQQKIGTYFKKLDRMLALHQRKHDKLVTLKQAMLQKMFPQEGATTPEIRFKGFEGDWETKKLGEMTALQTGHPFESKKFVKNGILLVRGMNVKRGYLDSSLGTSEYWPTITGVESFLLEEDDIVIQMDGALIGKSFAKIDREHLPALLVQRVTRIRCSVVNCDFIYQYIQKDFLSYINSTKTETAVPHLSLNDIRDFSITFPKKTEQQKIGTYFRKLDELITQHATQLEKLKQIKSACLEKMFV